MVDLKLPLHFFGVSFPVRYAEFSEDFFLSENYLLGGSGKYAAEEDFANVYMGWNECGIFLQVQVFLEDLIGVEKNEIEFFFDTGKIRAKSYMTKHCHHFLFSPFDKGSMEEITRFREGDEHKLKETKDFKTSVKLEKNGYFAKIFIPAECLFGYDPLEFNKLGFTYKISSGGMSQCFSVSPQEVRIERAPFFWAELILNGKDNG